MLKKILSVFLPEKCAVCRKITANSALICAVCFEKTRLVANPMCPLCGQPHPASVAISHPCADCIRRPPPFDWHRSCLHYKEPVNGLVYRFKYGHDLSLTRLFSSWIQKLHNDRVIKADYLIPVPLSMNRLKKRTYNQSLELARMISRNTKIPVLANSLRKIRDTPAQTSLDKKERSRNLSHAFCWKDKNIKLKGKKVVLIDDVYTTGSTLSACARILKPLKPQSIGALTIAIKTGFNT